MSNVRNRWRGVSILSALVALAIFVVATVYGVTALYVIVAFFTWVGGVSMDQMHADRVKNAYRRARRRK